MTVAELLTLQLSEPFRAGLLVALFMTMLRTRTATGTWLPLAAGAVFVAAILPMTSAGTGPQEAVPLVMRMAVGLVANAVLLGAILGMWTLYQRFQR